MQPASASPHLPLTPHADAASAASEATTASAGSAASEGNAATPLAAPEAVPAHEGSWQELIEGDQLAALEVSMVSDEDASHVANLCLQHADVHPEAVKRALFMNGQVRKEALELLQANMQCGPEMQKALALCFLEAGYELSGKPLAPVVAELLVQRNGAEDEYWALKQAHHGTSERKPFFYENNKYSRANLNGQISSADDPSAMFWCRHMETAVAENTKTYLQDISKRPPDVSKLNYKLLNETEEASRGAPTINFNPARMGKLLMRLALDVKLGEPRSFRVGWLGAGTGHGMRIFLEKTGDGFFKVGLYEPNVSGNISHLKVLPEKLTALKFDDFDTLKVRRGAGRAVLAIEVESPELAKSCAGAFVDKQHYFSQLDSLAQALAHGNLWEMDSSLTLLEQMEWPALQPDQQGHVAERLADSMYLAFLDGRSAAVKKFMDGLQHLHFTREQIAVMVTARAKDLNDVDGGARPIPTGLHTALEAGHSDTVEMFMAGLKGLPLTAAQIADIVAARNSDQLPGLHVAIQKGHDAAVKKFMAGLKDLRLAPAQIGEMVAAKTNRHDKVPALQLALQSGRDASVEEFMAGLKDLRLEPHQIAEIVAAKDSSSTPGLYWALRKGHAGAVGKFLQSLPGLGLAAAQNAEIVAAKDNRSDPGLFRALQDGQGAAVEVFLQNLAGLDLTTAQMLEIVQAKNALSVPGLCLAIRHGGGVAVREFMEGLRNFGDLGLSAEQVAEIAAARDPRRNNDPALNVALKMGNAVGVKEFMVGLQALRGLLTPPLMVDIVLSRDQEKTPGLYAALAAGQADAVEAFLTGLQSLGGPGGLTMQDFANIVSARPSEEDPPALQVAGDRGHADTVKRFYEVLSRSGLVRPPNPP